MAVKEVAVSAVLLVVFLGLTLPLWGAPSWVYVNSKLNGEDEFRKTALEITANESDTLKILNEMADWVNSRITYDISPSYWYPTCPFLLVRPEHPEPEWVLTVGRGACKETAVVFNAMANSVGIASRLVYNSGEDHVWCEVFVNGSWTRFDPLRDDEYRRFGYPRFYEDQAGWGKQLSYVYAVDSDGKRVDVTNNYTDTGSLVVKVEKGGHPIENAKVSVKSRFLAEAYPKEYSKPIIAVEKFTNESGICEFRLGGNHYAVSTKIDAFLGDRNEVNIQLQEKTNSSLLIVLSESGFSISWGSLFIAVLSILFSFLAVLTIFRGLLSRYCEE
jgi:hypothetical protein